LKILFIEIFNNYYYKNNVEQKQEKQKMSIEVVFIPEKKREDNVALKVEKLVEDRNRIISKRFNMKEEDLKVNLHSSNTSIKLKLDPNGDALGLFAGYVEGKHEIEIINPAGMGPVFGENLDREISKLVDFGLTKFYLCLKYYFEPQQFRTYYKYLSEAIAQVSSDTFKLDSAKFDIKTFSSEKRYSKEKEVNMVFYIMYTKSGLDFIYENIETMMKDCDIKKSIFTIYQKSFNDFVEQVQREVIEEAKKLQKVFRPGRR